MEESPSEGCLTRGPTEPEPPACRGALHLPPLGFGAAGIGNLYASVDEETALSAVHEALSQGINYFDTAPLYGYGLSEERLGRALRSVARTRFLISTKVGRVLEENSGSSAGTDDMFKVATSRRATFDYTRIGILRSFEASLKRLGVQSVDVLLLHDVGRLTHGERHEFMLDLALREALPVMSELKAAGACRAIGIGVNEEAVCLELLPRFELDCILLAGRYTLLEQDSSHGIMDEARKRSVAILAGAPFSSGLLGDACRPGTTYNYRPVDAQTLARAQRLYSVCREEGVDVGAAALQFPPAHPAVACVVAGVRSPQEARCAAARMHSRIKPRFWERLRRESLLAVDAPTPAP